MFCNLTRWLMSRAEDRGTTLPHFAGRHAARCGTCREYALFTGSLKDRFAAEVPGVLAKAPEVPLDLGSAGSPAREGVGDGARGLRRPWPFLRPLHAVAASLVVVSGALIFFLVVLREPAPSPQERAAALAALKSITSAPDDLGGIVGSAESSLVNERAILERSVLSAVEYLQARLNIRIERREIPKKL